MLCHRETLAALMGMAVLGCFIVFHHSAKKFPLHLKDFYGPPNRMFSARANIDALSYLQDTEIHSLVHNPLVEHSTAVADPEHYERVRLYLADHAVNGGTTIIVAVANSGHRDFFMNWREGMVRNVENRDKFIVVCLDREFCAFLQEREIPHLPISDVLAIDYVRKLYDEGAMTGEKRWEHDDYYLLTNMKVDVVYELVKEYRYHVIFTDVDLVWMNNAIVPYINHLFTDANYELVYSQDDWHDTDRAVCTGFYAVRPTPFAIEFLRSIITDPKRRVTHDQTITRNHLYALSWRDEARVHALPLILFQNGQAVQMDFSNKFKVHPWIIHANYRIGNADKRKLLQDAGVWYNAN